MFIENVEQLSTDSFQTRDIYNELLAIESELDRSLAVNQVRARAKMLGQTKVFDQNYKAAMKEFARFQKQELANSNIISGDFRTDFSLLDTAEQLRCGNWVADDEGVRIQTSENLQIACPHPIYISRILKNAETGKYKVELTYKVRGRKQTIYTNREIIATPSKILKLADDGIQVTSLNAPLLVKYLSDLESLNPDLIGESVSTSKLGWIDGINADGEKVKQFLPHQSSVVFDSELNFKSLFDSIKCQGDETIWYKCVKQIRAKRQPEFLINLAASFASVLVEPVGTLPFIVSLWGGTGIGKSVILKVCASVWADPSEGKYISDPKATYTAMEMRMNVLNHLPMMLDDMAQIKNQYDDDFSQLIYTWCSGKGRERSNKELGLNKLTSWRNCTITNGERSLVDESTQGGAINRVIDIEASGEALFDGKSGGKTVKIVEKNFGWAGDAFILRVSDSGFEYITQVFNEFYEKIKTAAEKQEVEKEEKQVVPMALILTADYLSEKWLFNDGVLIDIDNALSYLRNKGDVSEDSRAYEYLLNEIAVNDFKFKEFEDEESKKVENWGFWKDEKTVVINGKIFDDIVKRGGFQPKAFLSWCKRKNLIECDKKGNPKNVICRKGNCFRAVILNATYDTDTEEESNIAGLYDMELPFK